MYKNNNTKRIKKEFIKEIMLMFPYSNLLFPYSKFVLSGSNLSEVMYTDHEVFAWFMNCLLSESGTEQNAKFNNLAFFLGYDLDTFGVSVSSVKNNISKFISRINSKMNLLYGEKWGIDELNMYSMIKLGLSLNDLYTELYRNLNNIKSELFYNLDLNSIDICNNFDPNLFYKSHSANILKRIEKVTKTDHFYSDSFLNAGDMIDIVKLIDMSYVNYNGSVIDIDSDDSNLFLSTERNTLDPSIVYFALCETNSTEFEERNGDNIRPFEWVLRNQTNVIWKKLVETFIELGGIDGIAQNPLYEKYMDDNELYAFVTFSNGVIIPIPIRILGIRKFGDKYKIGEYIQDKEWYYSYNEDDFFSKFYFETNRHTINTGILKKFISSDPARLLKFIFPYTADIFVLNMKDIIYVLNNYLCDKKIDRLAMGIYRCLDYNIMMNDHIYININGIRIRKKIR